MIPPPAHYRRKPRPQLSTWSIVLVIAGVCFLFCGVGVLLIAVGMLVEPTAGQKASSPASAFVCGFVFCILPSAGMFAFGGRDLLRVRRMRRLMGLAETHARLPLEAVARDLGVSSSRARSLLLEAVTEQYVNGRLDLDHGVFVSADVDVVGRRWTGACPVCRAAVQVMLTAGEAGFCPYCRGSLGVTG